MHNNVKDNAIGRGENNFHFMSFYVVWILYHEQALFLLTNGIIKHNFPAKDVTFITDPYSHQVVDITYSTDKRIVKVNRPKFTQLVKILYLKGQRSISNSI